MRAANNDHPSWYVIMTKPKQEFRALEQLQNQGYICFVPTLSVETIRCGKLQRWVEPLFSRYLFIQLYTDSGNWAPIRSTRGVSRIVAFGNRFATLPDACVDALRSRSHVMQAHRFEPGERVTVTDGPFAGLEGIYQAPDGEARAMVLMELMSQPQKLRFAVETLCKAA